MLAMSDTVLPFIFVGFFIGFFLSLRFVQRPKMGIFWGLILSVLSILVLLIGVLTFRVGISLFGGTGGLLGNFADLALKLLMLNPSVVMFVAFITSGAGFGMAGGAVVLWVGRGRARWVGWSAGVIVVGIVVALALGPAALREVEKRQIAEHQNAIMRANFKGTLAGHQVAFPASPRLYLADDCGPWKKAKSFGCYTVLSNPVTRLPGPDEKLLHERNDPIIFNLIIVLPVQLDCRRKNDCLTQEKNDHWCGEIRPDQAKSIWCRDTLSMSFSLRTDEAARATIRSSDRDEPELTARYADTPLGPGQVSCFYHPDPAKTDQQGVSCRLTFNLVDGVTAILPASRARIITSGDLALTATIALIPDYWAALTGG